MATMYRIRDWDQRYENNRSRELKDLQFVLVPNRQDGDGYTTLVDHENGPAHLGAWLAILQIASKCKPRGTLVRGCGKPHTPETIGRMSHLPAGLCRDALERLTSEEIGWIEEVESVKESTRSVDLVTKSQEGAGSCRSKCDPYNNGTERNRTERNGTSSNGKTAVAVASPSDDPKQVQYMQVALAELGAHMRIGPPDHEICRKVLIEGRGASANEIYTVLRNMAASGQKPKTSWGWYPKMVREFFKEATR